MNFDGPSTTDNHVRKDDGAFCPKCKERLKFNIDILDPRTGEIYRLYRCGCGEITWTNMAA